MLVCANHTHPMEKPLSVHTALCAAAIVRMNSYSYSPSIRPPRCLLFSGSSFVSVATVKYPDGKQLEGARAYTSSQGQLQSITAKRCRKSEPVTCTVQRGENEACVLVAQPACSPLTWFRATRDQRDTGEQCSLISSPVVPHPLRQSRQSCPPQTCPPTGRPGQPSVRLSSHPSVSS